LSLVSAGPAFHRAGTRGNLPAFEGLDEIAHFSSILQIADTNTIPVLGSSFLDDAIENYQGPAMLEMRYFKRLFAGLLVYAVVFQIIALWAQLALYTGCASKTEDSFYAFQGNFFCLDQTAEILDRIGLLAWPSLAAIGFCAGSICFLLLLWQLGIGRGVAGKARGR
jgi:hypothetical protein